ncbi:fam-c protein [Plasmodium vinckei]|uniref:Fam-c protein n=1 Tax=Plasmodium vinckei TaxID=5860 RepID=A0A6V7T307_PLAVN|nr:fam-c protein [Plasmodium vinckei]
MNKRIFILVCIAGYLLSAVSIHCSQQKVPNAGNKSIRGIKEGKRRNEKNGIEFKRETQLKNNNPKGDNEFKNYNISKRDIQFEEYSNKTYNDFVEQLKRIVMGDYIEKN